MNQLFHTFCGYHPASFLWLGNAGSGLVHWPQLASLFSAFV
jgi:hypothetical protein